MKIWLVAIFLTVRAACAAPADEAFQAGTNAFRAGDYALAAQVFRASAQAQPASGTLQNLGLAEWHQGRCGQAILAWEQARWLDPFNPAVRANLRLARRTAQVETPNLVWYEVVSSWLPMNWWPWLTGFSLWFSVGFAFIPGLFRRRKTTWHQAAAAIGLVMFLLSLPALFGVASRSRLGFVLQKHVPLRLTPTEEAQFITRLDDGEPARIERVRGKYLLIRTSHASGWVTRSEFGVLSRS